MSPVCPLDNLDESKNICNKDEINVCIRNCFCYTNNVTNLTTGPNSRNVDERKHTMTRIESPATLSPTILEMAPTPAILDEGRDAQVVPPTSPVHVARSGKISINASPAYSSFQERVLGDLSIDTLSAALADIRFDGDTPVPAARLEGGLYMPPAIRANVESSEILIVTATALDAVAGDCHRLACVALDPNYKGIPAALLPLLGERGLVLLRESGRHENNEVLRLLERDIRAQTSVTIAVKTCPAPAKKKPESGKEKTVKASTDVAEKVVIAPQAVFTLGQWIKAKTARGINSVLFKAIGDERRPDREGGYEALGYVGDTCAVFSKSRNVVKCLSASELGKLESMSMAVGADYIKSAYANLTEKTGAATYDMHRLAMDVTTSCDQLGEFDTSRVFGTGTWRDDEGRLLINSDKLFYADGTPAKRIDGERVYTQSRGLGISPETRPATAAETREIFDWFNQYNFPGKRGPAGKAGALTTFGWAMNSLTAGANDWRQALLLSGVAGSGKSVIAHVMAEMLGSSCLYMGGMTEAHVRQKLDRDALGVIFDDVQKDKKDRGAEMQKVLQFVRRCATGVSDGKGGADGTPRNFIVRAQVFFTANDIPEMQDPDKTRFVFLKIDKMNRADFKPSRLVPIPDAMNFPLVKALGKKIFARMIQSNGRYLENLSVVRRNLDTDSARAGMTLGPAIAGAYTALHDDVLDDAAALAWMKNFDIEEAIHEIEEAQSGSKIVDFLSSKPAPYRVDDKMMTISQLWESAHLAENGHKKNGGAYSEALMVMGMRVKQGIQPGDIEVRIFPKREGFRALFEKSEWEGGIDGIRNSICQDPRASASAGTAKCGIKGLGEKEKNQPERYISLQWTPAESLKAQDAAEHLEKGAESYNERRARFSITLHKMRDEIKALMDEIDPNGGRAVAVIELFEEVRAKARALLKENDAADEQAFYDAEAMEHLIFLETVETQAERKARLSTKFDQMRDEALAIADELNAFDLQAFNAAGHIDAEPVAEDEIEF